MTMLYAAAIGLFMVSLAGTKAAPRSCQSYMTPHIGLIRSKCMSASTVSGGATLSVCRGGGSGGYNEFGDESDEGGASDYDDDSDDDGAVDDDESLSLPPRRLPAPPPERRSPPARPPPGGNTGGLAGNQMQWMITQYMRAGLLKLAYTPHEIDRMDPRVAKQVLDKQLRRPRYGMPVEWERGAGGACKRRTATENPLGAAARAVKRLGAIITAPVRVVLSMPLRSLLKAAGVVSLSVVAKAAAKAVARRTVNNGEDEYYEEYSDDELFDYEENARRIKSTDREMARYLPGGP